jgi:hypothetical protein
MQPVTPTSGEIVLQTGNVDAIIAAASTTHPGYLGRNRRKRRQVTRRTDPSNAALIRREKQRPTRLLNFSKRDGSQNQSRPNSRTFRITRMMASAAAASR